MANKIIEKARIAWRKTSAEKQLLLIGGVLISALVTFTAWLWVMRAQAGIDKSVQQFGIAYAQVLADGAAEALVHHGNLADWQAYIVSEQNRIPALVYVAFCDQEGKILLEMQSQAAAHSNAPIFLYYKQPAKFKRVPHIYLSPPGYRSVTNIVVPVHSGTQQLGTCWVGLDNHSFTLLGTPVETRYFLFSIFGLIGVLGAMGLWTNSALINRPLRALSSGASEIATGHFGHQIEEQKAGREIDQVVNSFNYMSRKLQDYDKQNVDHLKAEKNRYLSERNKFELVLMSIADGVVVCDQDRRVQIVNAAASAIFAKDVEELVGKPLVFCTEGPDSPHICQVVQNFTDTLSPHSLAPVVQQIHLDDRIIRLHIAPIILNSEFLGSVVIMNDVTKQTELEKMKTEFVSNVSHELRTPITSIKSYVDTLCNHGEKLDPEIYREFLQIIDNEADRLMHLVNDVLELSRVEEGGELEVAPLSLPQAAEAAIRSVNLMARDRSIDLSLLVQEPIPPTLMNEESIERVIINLLTNAIKYTPIAGKITVNIRYEPEANEVGLHVTDNGQGIPEEFLSQIFDRFYRVERKVHTVKGTGLGLTIARKIVEQHKGRMQVQSAMGVGSTFSFYLPAADSQSEDL